MSSWAVLIALMVLMGAIVLWLFGSMVRSILADPPRAESQDSEERIEAIVKRIEKKLDDRESEGSRKR